MTQDDMTFPRYDEPESVVHQLHAEALARAQQPRGWRRVAGCLITGNENSVKHYR